MLRAVSRRAKIDVRPPIPSSVENNEEAIATLRGGLRISKLGIETYDLVLVTQDMHTPEPPLKHIASLVLAPIGELHNVFDNNHLISVDFREPNDIHCGHATPHHRRIIWLPFLPKVNLSIFPPSPTGWAVSSAFRAKPCDGAAGEIARISIVEINTAMVNLLMVGIMNINRELPVISSMNHSNPCLQQTGCTAACTTIIVDCRNV